MRNIHVYDLIERATDKIFTESEKIGNMEELFIEGLFTEDMITIQQERTLGKPLYHVTFSGRTETAATPAKALAKILNGLERNHTLEEAM